MKTVIYTHDPMLTLVHSLENAVDIYGEDYIEEFGVEVPDIIVDAFIYHYEKVLELSRLLRSIEDKK